MAEKQSRYFTYIAPIIRTPIVHSYGPYIFSLLTMAIFLIFAIRPTIATITVLDQNIANQTRVLNGLNSKSQALRQAQVNLDGLDQATLTKISSLLPPQANISSLINSLKSSLDPTASISALQIQPVTVIDNTEDQKILPELKEADFSFVISGSYQSLITSLDKITKADRLINITEINMSRQNQAPMTMSITGKAYFIKWLEKNF